MPLRLPKIRIDGNDVAAHQVLSHYQDVSYPGGHHFVLQMPFDFIPKKIQGWAKFVAAENPDTETARNWFYWLGSLFGKWNRAVGNQVSKADKPKYVLNTITRVHVEEGCYVFHGEASPLLQNPPQ